MPMKRRSSISISLPPQELKEVLRFRRLLGTNPTILGHDGQPLEIPAPLLQVFGQMTQWLSSGQLLHILPHQQELSTQEAAELLNVSRPFLVKLLDGEKIPHVMVGSHRRVRLEDLLAYQNRRELQSQKSPGGTDRFHQHIEKVRFVTYIIDLEGDHPLYFSPQIEILTGFSVEEWCLADFFIEHVYPEDRSAVEHAMKRSIDCHEAFVMDYRIVKRDGGLIWFHDEATVEPNEDGGLSLHGTLFDITEHRKVDEALRESELKLRRRLSLEELISDISTRFIKATFKDIDEEISRAMARIGRFLEIDRVHIYQSTEDFSLSRMMYEWCEDGLEPFIEQMQALPSSENRWWTEQLRNLEVVKIPSVVSLPRTASRQKELLALKGIRSLIMIPLEIQKKSIGSLGFSWIRSENALLPEDVALFKLVADVFASLLLRKKNGESLQVFQNRLQDIDEKSRVWFWEIDPEGRYTFVSRGIERILGYSPEEVIGKHCYDFYIQEKREALKVQLGDIIEKRESFSNLDKQEIKKNGEAIWLHSSGGPFFDDAGRLLGLRGIKTDIDASQKTQDELRKAQKKLEILLSVSPAILFASEPFGDYATTFISQNIRQLGYEPREFLENPSLWSSVIHPEEAPQVFFKRHELFEEGALSQEYRFRQKDGTYRWIRSEQVLIKEGDHPVEILGALLDITEKRELREKLIRSERRMMHLQSTSPAITYNCQPFGDYAVTFLSGNVNQFGYLPKEFLVDPSLWSASIHPEDAPQVFFKRRQIFEKGELTLEYRFLHRNGSYRWIRDFSSLIKDNGKPIEIVGYWLDITEQKELKAEVDIARKTEDG